MKTFFSSTFLKEKTLNEARINYPIKLEYYKIVNEENETERKNAKFGIDIMKIEYKKEGKKVEDKEVQYVSDDEEKIENIIKILEKNEVTPIALEEILNDIDSDFKQKSLQNI